MTTSGLGRSNAYHRWSMGATGLRKRRVATLVARGYDPYEIVQQMGTPMMPDPAMPGGERPNPMYTVNPTTGDAYSDSTIRRDVEEIMAAYSQFNSERIAEERGRLVHEVDEIRRGLWARTGTSGLEAYELLMEAVRLTANLAGANMPLEVRSQNINVSVADLAELSNEALERIANGEPVEVVLRECRDGLNVVEDMDDQR